MNFLYFYRIFLALCLGVFGCSQRGRNMCRSVIGRKQCDACRYVCEFWRDYDGSANLGGGERCDVLHMIRNTHNNAFLLPYPCCEPQNSKVSTTESKRGAEWILSRWIGFGEAKVDCDPMDFGITAFVSSFTIYTGLWHVLRWILHLERSSASSTRDTHFVPFLSFFRSKTEPFCFPDILPGCCPVCAGVLRRLYRCVALNNAGLDANIDVLARECELDCSEFLMEIDGGDSFLNMTDMTNNTNSTF